jgi:hypothetical protein
MEVGLLGPVAVGDGPRRLVLGGPKPRALVAVLLLHANRLVSTDRLIDELWVEAKDRVEPWSKPHLLGARSRAPPDQGAASSRPLAAILEQRHRQLVGSSDRLLSRAALRTLLQPAASHL